MSDNKDQDAAMIGAFMATVQIAANTLREAHSLALCVAVDGTDLGQVEIVKASQDELDRLMALLPQFPRGTAAMMRKPRETCQ